jgi:predicted Rossmann fold flavoprotein
MTPRDLAIVGAGAAGLAAGIFAGRRRPGTSIEILDGATKLGAKILVSGGGRCNVTNVDVAETDFWGGSRNVVRRILRAFPAARAAEFFREIGVALRREEDGKLFPATHSARTVLDALLREAARVGARVQAGRRVTSVRRLEGQGFELETPVGPLRAKRVILATGGLSLPKTGSDGLGYRIAESLGHTIVATSPALDALVLEGSDHAALSGVAQDAEISVRIDGERPLRLRGSMLWTHFGASGPAALNASRHWHRARMEGRSATLEANLLPGLDFEAADRRLQALARQHPAMQAASAVARLVPARVAEAALARAGAAAATRMNRLEREPRCRLARALTAWPLPVVRTRGYNFAEVTAGGVPLREVDPSTLESRVCPGLFLVGEILDVDGRLGGFNFQWAWSTGFVAGSA